MCVRASSSNKLEAENVFELPAPCDDVGTEGECFALLLGGMLIELSRNLICTTLERKLNLMECLRDSLATRWTGGVSLFIEFIESKSRRKISQKSNF